MTKGIKNPSYRNRIGYHSGLLGSVGLLASAILVVANVETHEPIAKAKAAEKQASIEQVLPASIHDNDFLKDAVEIPLADGSTRQIYVAKKEGVLTGIAFETAGNGYAGAINIIIGIDKDGNVLGVRTLAHKETPGLGDKIEASKSDWINSFTGKSLSSPDEKGWKVKKDGGIFDQFTGATITPRGVVHAVKDCLDFYALKKADILAAVNKPVAEGTVPTGESSHGN
ncbi:electron transport complex subunit RsxG [Beggiatoa leptomitoformis]|uniref:Ion-translocating oxidoreductase complex subunit G n=1 Tax=Beggiatoa leptomitoformis TaxID=288004 RepID=A0A2N9YB08_9GAMM|nr:electron transport complex subunit RsxG [Beggiatoa leptomitoformis]ALG66976.1 electron transport complex subunit RsxG [Beggiatoa leptomitoformis]AUI67653.1 electron transport complex subunit RsxG [Beggiatoa leptomitoformis]